MRNQKMCLAKDKDQARIVVRLLTGATRIGNPRFGATPDPFFLPPGMVLDKAGTLFLS